MSRLSSRTMSSFPKSIKAVQVQKPGPIEVIEQNEIPFPTHGEDEVLIKVEYAGVNFIDTYFRGGVYPLPKVPFTLGNEAAGEIVALPTSKKVLDDAEYKQRNFKVGDKVVASQPGSFSEYVSLPWGKVIPLPQSVDVRSGAAVVLQGLTALTFAIEAYEIKKGDYVLIYAAAGGVGLLLTQIAVHLGATVIGTTSSQDKAEIVKQHGAHHVIVVPRDSPSSTPEQNSFIVKEVLRITKNEGVHGVFDGVGKDTFDDNFILTRRKGTIVSLGNASGAVPPFAPLKLGAKNLKLVRPRLDNYIFTPEETFSYSNKLFELIASGAVKVNIYKDYPFTAEGVQESQRDITGRGTTGKLLIKVA